MRSFDFAPYYRSTVGFDRLFSMLDQVGGVEASAPSFRDTCVTLLPEARPTSQKTT